MAIETHFSRGEFDCLPKLHSWMGTRSSSASQIHRHKCRSTQFKAWLLFLAHGMAGAAKASRCKDKRCKYFDGWLGTRSNRYVSEEVRNAVHSFISFHSPQITIDTIIILLHSHRYYTLLMPTFAFIIPTLIPYLVLDEKLSYSSYIAGALRYMMTLHFTWLVNSAAHIWGMRPYDKWVFCNAPFPTNVCTQRIDYNECFIFRTIRPTNNVTVAFLALGEGWHNYHHVFPWDYKTSELGDYSLNMTTALIDFFAKIGKNFQ